MQKIPVFILAGGLGTRISEESRLKPKPMVEIGQIPLLIHIMRWYYSFGFNDFVICAGYLSWEIKNYFLNYEFRSRQLEIDHRQSIQTRAAAFGSSIEQENWRVRVIDTGTHCMTGGRLARAYDMISSLQKFTDFAVTYGDGVSDVLLDKEFEFHENHHQIGTVLGVHPIARFGELEISPANQVTCFSEKPQAKQGLINGGFFFFKSQFRDYLSLSSDCILEKKPLIQLSNDRQLQVFRHSGFWQPMDTLREKELLQHLWDEEKAPWIPKNRQKSFTPDQSH